VGSWTHVRLNFTNCDPEISGGLRDRGDTEVIVISNAFSGVDQALANSVRKRARFGTCKVGRNTSGSGNTAHHILSCSASTA
jgi:hypothetical protein